jgi:hypothetical protein
MPKEINIDFDYSKVRGSTELHEKFKKEVMVVVPKKFEDVIVIPYDVGFFRAWSDPDIPVRCGMVGVPDLIALGKDFYYLFDTKTGKNELSKEQKNFREIIYDINGKHRVHKLNTIRQALEIIAGEY